MALPLAHLSRRFFQVINAQPLRPSEQAVVAGFLSEPEQRLFWRQSSADQRHAFETMRRLRHHTEVEAAIQAALLHDVGKTNARLGAIGRVVATLFDAVGVPLRGRLAAYRRHGALGAQMLESAGAAPLVVDFARRHPDPDPGPHDPVLWSALLAADDA